MNDSPPSTNFHTEPENVSLTVLPKPEESSCVFENKMKIKFSCTIQKQKLQTVNVR